jgi:hypothetical protein
VASAVALSACSDDDNPAGPGGNQDAYVGTWTATSFVVSGMDLVDLGMGLEATLTTSSYSLTVTDDVVGICEGSGSADCTETGTLSGSGSQVTFDPGTTDEAVFDYTIVGSNMTLTGAIDGEPVSITFHKVS